MKINFNAKAEQYKAHKESIDKLLIQTLTHEEEETNYITSLEKHLSDYTQAKDVIVCNTQFNAFILLFMVLGLKSGDEVITSPLSSGIAVQAALFMGAKVIFVDVNNSDFTLDVEQVEDAITERTKLIIPISLFGNCADMESINALALQHDLCVIEDGAESFGSHYKGEKSCQLSKLATTSFFPTMPLHGFGNGAAIFIEDEALRNRARELRSQGKKEHRYVALGIEACMDQAQAGIVNFKLSIFDEEIKRRQVLAKRYDDALKTSKLVLPTIDAKSNYACYPVCLNNREKTVHVLKEQGIETKQPFSAPLHLHTAFSFMDYTIGDFPVSEQLSHELLLLPLHAYMTHEQQTEVIQALKAI